MVITKERLAQFAALSLSAGSHAEFERGVCAMEAVAYIAGEPHSDHPACACPVITAFMIGWNDGLPNNAERDRLLKPFLPRLVGTRSTKEVEERRAFLAMDWFIRVQTPAWLDLVEDLKPHAAAIRALDAVHDLATLQASTPSLRSARDAASKEAAAARAAAWDAARAAARAAAWAAARDAAWAAAASALAPTVLALQVSATDLLERMLAVQPETTAAIASAEAKPF